MSDNRKELTLDDLLTRAENYKQESPEETEKKVKEFEALNADKYKLPNSVLAIGTSIKNYNSVFTAFKNSNNAMARIVESTRRTQLMLQEFKATSLAIHKIKSPLVDMKRAIAFIEISKNLKIGFDIFSGIDWDKVNAYKLIEELEKEGIDPKIIGDFTLEQLGYLRKEAKKIKLSLARTIKDKANLENKYEGNSIKLSYDTMLETIEKVKDGIKQVEEAEMIAGLVQECLKNQQEKPKENGSKTKNKSDDSKNGIYCDNFKKLSIRRRELVIEVLKAHSSGVSMEKLAERLGVTASYLNKDIKNCIKDTFEVPDFICAYTKAVEAGFLKYT